jgi:hypothetical protein
MSAASQTSFSEWKGLPICLSLLKTAYMAASIFKTPPATEAAGGAFEPTFPADFSSVYICSPSQR